MREKDCHRDKESKMRIRFLVEIQTKEVPPGSGKRTIDFEYEYAVSKDEFAVNKDLSKDSLDDIINNIRTILNKFEFKEKDKILLKKISIEE